MIPGNIVTPILDPAAFQPPYNEAYNPFIQTVQGGNAISDPSAGRQVKDWAVSYSGGIISVGPKLEAVVFTLEADDVETISLAFDSNMSVVLAWKTPTGAKLYYYDTLTSTYITRVFADVTSCRVGVDDAREVNVTNSDVIFAYTLNGNLYWRQQRDRYDIERLAGATTNLLKRMGPSVSNRLQFELW